MCSSDLLCGFVSDEALGDPNSEEFSIFIQRCTRTIIHEERSKPTPWELYNRICPFLSCVLYSHHDDDLELYTHMIFNKFSSYTKVTGSSFSTAELNKIGNELKKLCRNPDYSKTMGFFIKTIREKSHEIS